MICLVTGATGFVGSAVARKLIAAGHHVRVLARASSDRRNLADLPVEIAIGSLAEPATLPQAVEGIEALFHVAADYRLWVPDEALMYRTNVDGTVALMEAALAAGVKRVVHTSSVATLGLLPRGQDADEETPVSLADMIGPYKRSKYLAEEGVTRLVRERGLPAVIVNPSTPIGPRDIKPTPTGRLIVEAASGRMPAYVDTGLNFAHVDDVAEGHLQAFERGRIGERYILGGENLTLAQVLAIVCPLAGRKPPRIRLPADLILPLAYAAEAVSRVTGREPFVTVDGVRLAKKLMFFKIDKARRELGYAPRPAALGFRDAVAWFQASGAVPCHAAPAGA
ncbi:MAG: dihydroflavonol-4-reductase [Aliidongia sp.]|jgi:dihydroflavonol-4-reductase|nr:dihydroflavonol-4-reductase [Aliidongia sp.]